MIQYRVRYTLANNVYETIVATSGSKAAMQLIELTHPSAINISIVG